jgi:magnesium-transporting ATPase (P-type)
VGTHASTMAFTALVLVHPFQAMNCRSSRLPWWRLRPNLLVPLSLVALFALQWLAIEWGSLARLLGTTPLGDSDWLVLAAGVLWPVVALEGLKALRVTPSTAAPAQGVVSA